MPISKRTLTKWRKEALKYNAKEMVEQRPIYEIEMNNQILLLTAELLDQQLLKEK